jgi:hypothetical protein
MDPRVREDDGPQKARALPSGQACGQVRLKNYCKSTPVDAG